MAHHKNPKQSDPHNRPQVSADDLTERPPLVRTVARPRRAESIYIEPENQPPEEQLPAQRRYRTPEADQESVRPAVPERRAVEPQEPHLAGTVMQEALRRSAAEKSARQSKRGETHATEVRERRMPPEPVMRQQPAAINPPKQHPRDTAALPSRAARERGLDNSTERPIDIVSKALQEETQRLHYQRQASQAASQRYQSRLEESWHDLREIVYVPGLEPHLPIMVCIAFCAAILWGLFNTPLGLDIGFYNGPTTWSEWWERGGVLQSPAPAEPEMLQLEAPTGESSLLGAPTISAQSIDAILAEYGSPAVGSGQAFYDLGLQYGIDPAYALAFFIHESSAGTNPGWAGIKPGGGTTHNIGNIICAGYPTCYNRFRDYPGWTEGIDDWYKLISVEYINGRGTHTVEQIIPIYAPSFENNVPAYVQAVNDMVNQWRREGR